MKKNRQFHFLVLGLIIVFGSGAIADEIIFHTGPLDQSQYAAVASIETPTNTFSLPPESPINYTDNKNGTVTDNYTGLIWKKCPQGLSGTNCTSGSVSLREWSIARAECEDLNFAGKSSWRLPTAKELQSIVYASSTDIAINKKFFVATKDAYWTLTSPGEKAITKLSVLFSDGSTFVTNSGNALAIRCIYESTIE